MTKSRDMMQCLHFGQTTATLTHSHMVDGLTAFERPESFSAENRAARRRTGFEMRALIGLESDVRIGSRYVIDKKEV